MKRAAGISLIELLVTLLIFSILCGFTIFSIQTIYQKNQIERLENEISAAVHYARNQAIAQAIPLKLIPLAENNDWSKGLRLINDKKEIIQEWQWNHHDLQVDWYGFHSKHYLLFAIELKQAACNGAFTITSDEGKVSRLVVNRFGRVSKENPKL